MAEDKAAEIQQHDPSLGEMLTGTDTNPDGSQKQDIVVDDEKVAEIRQHDPSLGEILTGTDTNPDGSSKQDVVKTK